MKNPIDADRIHDRFIIPAAAIAAGLGSSIAVSAPGDLDATFGDVGRASLPVDLTGAVWSLEASVDGGYMYAGGVDDYCSYYYAECYTDGFTGGLLETGLPNPGFAKALLKDTNVHDVVRQPDGKQVVVGSRSIGRSYALVAYRLMPDGSPDAAFGTNGSFVLTGQSVVGRSVEVDADGRVVIAGIDRSQLLVLRLTPSGALDESFGQAGVYRGMAGMAIYGAAETVKAPAGGYRVLTSGAGGCVVTAITAGGALDGQFGQLGSAVIGTRGGSQSHCSALAVQPDGGLIIGGADGTGALAVRLRADGSTDPSFVATEVQAELANVQSLALAPDGSFVAGVREKNPSPGALVARLRPDGRLDRGYGVAGVARVDIWSETGSVTDARTLRVLPNGGVLVGGAKGRRPFVAKLIAAGTSPGVLGFSAFPARVEAKDQRAVVAVRRTGGSAGAVSVAYATEPDSAQSGQHFTPVTGRLDWADGDRSERTITVPIASNANAGPEKIFRVLLANPQGGAGIGSSPTSVAIAGEGYPVGVLAFVELSAAVSEPSVEGRYQSLELHVYRQFYGSGAVTVTVAPQSGSATLGEDFQMTPVTLNWADGDMSNKVVNILVLNDGKKEAEETFSVTLSSPTGGATIGTTNVPVTIMDAPSAKKSSGGGGRTGVLALLLLGAARLLRRRPA